jgi:hypothetical protein
VANAMSSINKPSGNYVHYFEIYYERNLVKRNFEMRGLTVKALGYLKMIISVTSSEFYSLDSYDHLSALPGYEEC